MLHFYNPRTFIKASRAGTLRSEPAFKCLRSMPQSSVNVMMQSWPCWKTKEYTRTKCYDGQFSDSFFKAAVTCQDTCESLEKMGLLPRIHAFESIASSRHNTFQNKTCKSAVQVRSPSGWHYMFIVMTIACVTIRESLYMYTVLHGRVSGDELSWHDELCDMQFSVNRWFVRIFIYLKCEILEREKWRAGPCIHWIIP